MKKICSLFIFVLSFQTNFSQNNDLNVITTAVPFLLINPNAQSMGIADIGVVAAEGYYESGLTQNPALLSRNEKVVGVKTSYKPWLRNLVPDINMFDFSTYWAFSKKSALGYSYNRFSLGSVTYTDANGSVIGVGNAWEFCHSLKYAQSITPNLSIGLGVKYIQSNLTNNMNINGKQSHPGKSIAADIGLDYRKDIAKKETSFWRYDIGASIVNMGSKIKYVDSTTGDFLPMLLSVGTMWTFNKNVDADLKYCVDFAYQFEKLLVPTPPTYYTDIAGNRTIVEGKDPDVSVFKGAVQSFYDAPDGANEEFAEVIHKVGIENRLVFKERSSIAIRAGYFDENRRKGDRKYFNVGAGIKIWFIYLDGGIILYYKQNDQFQSAMNHPFSWNVTLGYKYTFK